MNDDDFSKYNVTRSTLTGERIILIRKTCKHCGHKTNFLTRHPLICSHCGYKVYPDDKYEFEDKIMKEIKKK